jgi:hypothetical protein
MWPFGACGRSSEPPDVLSPLPCPSCVTKRTSVGGKSIGERTLMSVTAATNACWCTCLLLGYWPSWRLEILVFLFYFNSKINHEYD